MVMSCFCPYCGADNAPGDTLCHVCQHQLDMPPDFQETPLLLNKRYEVLTQVGAGGFGAVYKARDMQTQDRLVAVKQINLTGSCCFNKPSRHKPLRVSPGRRTTNMSSTRLVVLHPVV